jgi:hypothetical protein
VHEATLWSTLRQHRRLSAPSSQLSPASHRPHSEAVMAYSNANPP